MPSFLSKVFGRKKDDKGTHWDSGELLGGKFEAVSPNVSPSAAQYLELEPATNDEPVIDNEKDHTFAFFRSKSRPSSPEVKPTRLFDTLPPLSLNFDDLKDKNTSNGHIFQELDADAILPDAVIGGRRLNPFEALLLVRACSQAITSRGLETLGIMTPHWYSASPDVQRSLISRYITSLNTMSPTTATSASSPQISNFEYEVELTRSIHDVAAVLRWGLRHLQLDGDSFGTDDGWYKAFLDAEADENYPPKAFSEKLASKLPLLHFDLLLTTLELLSSLASFSESNSTSGSKLSKIFGLWLLTARRVEDKDDWRTFYSRWERTGRMLEHLFLARIRDQSTDRRMPIRLLELVRKYPYTHGLSSPTTDLQLLPRPQTTTALHDALLVRVTYEVSSQKEIPTSKINPSVLLADAFSTKVEGEYAELWGKITSAASKMGTEAPLANVFAEETIRLLSLVSDKPKEDGRSPTFSLLSLVETHQASLPKVTVKQHMDSVPAATPLSPINIGADWEHFSNSGFLNVGPNILPLASTLFDTDVEKTVPPDLPPPISRKSSRRVVAPRKVEASQPTTEVPPPQEPVQVEPPPQPKQVITTSGFEVVQIDEAFADFWSDALLDPISSEWPAFILCKFKPALLPGLTFGPEGDSKTLTWLVLEQMFTIKPPATPRAVSPPPEEVEQPPLASPIPQSPSGRRRFNFWSLSRTTSASSTVSQKTKKPKVLKVNELGEVVEDDVKEDTVKIKLPSMKRKSSESKKSKERKSETQESAKSIDMKPSSSAPLPVVLEGTVDTPAVVATSSAVVAATVAVVATQVMENSIEPEISAAKDVAVTSKEVPQVVDLHVDSTVDSRVVEPDKATEVEVADVPKPQVESEPTLREESTAVETASEPEAPTSDQKDLSIPIGQDEVAAATFEAQTSVQDEPGPLTDVADSGEGAEGSYQVAQTIPEELPQAPPPVEASEDVPAIATPLVTEAVAEEFEEAAPELPVEDTVTEEPVIFEEKLAEEVFEHPDDVQPATSGEVNDESSVVEIHAIAKEATPISEDPTSQQEPFVEEDLKVDQEDVIQDPSQIVGEETAPAPDVEESPEPAAEVDLVEQETPPVSTDLTQDSDVQPEAVSEAIQEMSHAPSVEVPESTPPEAAPILEAAPPVGDLLARDVTLDQETPTVVPVPEIPELEPAVAAEPPTQETMPTTAEPETEAGVTLETAEETTAIATEADETVPGQEPIETIEEEVTGTGSDLALEVETEAAAPIEEPSQEAMEGTPADMTEAAQVAEHGVDEVAIQDSVAASVDDVSQSTEVTSTLEPAHIDTSDSLVIEPPPVVPDPAVGVTTETGEEPSAMEDTVTEPAVLEPVTIPDEAPTTLEEKSEEGEESLDAEDTSLRFTQPSEEATVSEEPAQVETTADLADIPETSEPATPAEPPVAVEEPIVDDIPNEQGILQESTSGLDQPAEDEDGAAVEDPPEVSAVADEVGTSVEALLLANEDPVVGSIPDPSQDPEFPQEESTDPTNPEVAVVSDTPAPEEQVAESVPEATPETIAVLEGVSAEIAGGSEAEVTATAQEPSAPEVMEESPLVDKVPSDEERDTEDVAAPFQEESDPPLGEATPEETNTVPVELPDVPVEGVDEVPSVEEKDAEDMAAPLQEESDPTLGEAMPDETNTVPVELPDVDEVPSVEEKDVEDVAAPLQEEESDPSVEEPKPDEANTVTVEPPGAPVEDQSLVGGDATASLPQEADEITPDVPSTPVPNDEASENGPPSADQQDAETIPNTVSPVEPVNEPSEPSVEVAPASAVEEPAVETVSDIDAALVPESLPQIEPRVSDVTDDINDSVVSTLETEVPLADSEPSNTVEGKEEVLVESKEPETGEIVNGDSHHHHTKLATDETGTTAVDEPDIKHEVDMTEDVVTTTETSNTESSQDPGHSPDDVVE